MFQGEHYHRAMLTRADWEAYEAAHLAPWAMRSAESRGRRYPEQEHPIRTCFQRDRDRIVHCSSFRRLEYKTQVFVNHEGDHYRTRLTHTLEAAQISRTIARALRLNEDLTEAVALAHDLGHTPFGHAGEDALRELMREHGGFEHNRQSLRILEHLERRYPEFPGLNLTWEVREGIIKHSPGCGQQGDAEYEPDRSPCLEAQLIDFCDEVAYMSHDVDDGIASGMLDLAGLNQIQLWGDTYRDVKCRYPQAEEQVLRYQTVRGIINRLATELIEETDRRIRQSQVTVGDAPSHSEHRVGFSDSMLASKNELKDYLFENLYRHYRVIRMGDKARRIIRDLFEVYLSNPRQFPPQMQARLAAGDRHRVICDYIAGMTDRFALDEHRRLFDPHERV